MSWSIPKPSLCLVTPALADANNGNWQTARRWARMLSGHYRVRLVKQWPDGLHEVAPVAASDVTSEGADGAATAGAFACAFAAAGGGAAASDDTHLLLALHARRSAASVAAWAEAHPERPLVLALTGTDLYRDIASDASAQRSLALAHRLIVLQEQGPLALPGALRERARVVFQSSARRATLPKTRAHLRALMVGHLRDEKWPQTLWQAARLLRPEEGICIDHLGAALDPALGEQALATARDCPHYRWLGGQPHAQVRARIQRAHLLVHTSRMEGGAHVILEAVQSGTPVLASRVAGNVGMLGADYAGYFEPGDAAALVALLRAARRAQQDGAGGGLLQRLQAQCALRAPLFEPAAERAALLAALDAAFAAARAAAMPPVAAAFPLAAAQRTECPGPDPFACPADPFGADRPTSEA